MQPEIIQKYNRPVPRYTSYPPANYFGEFSETDYLCAVNASDSARQNQISFYLHIPFCRHLCHYCGCNSYPAAKPETVEAYVGRCIGRSTWWPVILTTVGRSHRYTMVVAVRRRFPFRCSRNSTIICSVLHPR